MKEKIKYRVKYDFLDILCSVFGHKYKIYPKLEDVWLLKNKKDILFTKSLGEGYLCDRCKKWRKIL